MTTFKKIFYFARAHSGRMALLTIGRGVALGIPMVGEQEIADETITNQQLGSDICKRKGKRGIYIAFLPASTSGAFTLADLARLSIA